MRTVLEKRRERTSLFLSFCDMVCPTFKNRSRSSLGTTATNLDRPIGALEELYASAKAFRKKNPDCVNVSGEIPKPPGGSQKSYEYRQVASAFIKENTAIVIPIISTIPCSLYSSVIDYCIRKE